MTLRKANSERKRTVSPESSQRGKEVCFKTLIKMTNIFKTLLTRHIPQEGDHYPAIKGVMILKGIEKKREISVISIHQTVARMLLYVFAIQLIVQERIY